MNRERLNLELSREMEGQNGMSFGLYIPQTVLTNEEIESWNVKTPGGHVLTAESIIKKTGVSKRYVAKPYEDSFYMATIAAKKIFKGKRTDAIFATGSYPTGINTARSLKELYGLDSEVEIDVFAACSGFTKALSVIKNNEEDYIGKKIAIISSEKYSDKVFDLKHEGVQNDPSLAQTIFSDGAAAFSFTYGKDLTVLASKDQRLPKGLSYSIRMPINSSLMKAPFVEEYVPRSSNGRFEQEGKTVYKAVIEYIPNLIRETVDKAGLEPDDISLIIPHQGSIHVVQGLQKYLPEYEDRVFLDIEEGNFSSASVPKALGKAFREGLINKNDKVVLAGFGAGLFASVAVVEF